MKSRQRWNLLFLLAWAVAVIAAGSWLGHWLFQGSRALAEVAAHKQINAPVNWLAGYAREFEFGTYHRAGVVFTAAMAAFPFFPALLQADGHLRREFRAFRENRTQISKAIACGFFCVIGTIALGTPIAGRIPDFPHSSWLTALQCCLFAFAIELTFRGVFWQMISATFGTLVAWALTTALYMIFILSIAPPGIDSWNPILASDRFPLWPSIGRSFLWPELWSQVVPLFLIGTAACYLRKGQSSLWLPIGAQAGFLFSNHLGTPPVVPALATVLSIVVCVRTRNSALPETT